jgi:hypothetical protein
VFGNISKWPSERHLRRVPLKVASLGRSRVACGISCLNTKTEHRELRKKKRPPEDVGSLSG